MFRFPVVVTALAVVCYVSPSMSLHDGAESSAIAAGADSAALVSDASEPGGDSVPAVDSTLLDTNGTASRPIQELGRLVVQGHRLAGDKSGVTRIGAEEFRGLFADLPSVLEQVSGVTIRRTGGFGEYATASIRGSSPKQVMVYLDGIPLNSAAGGAVDLSKIPLNTLQGITVYKSAAPLELMGDAAGGVINLSTAGGTDMINGIVELGSYGYHKAGMLARKRFGDVVNRLSVDYTNADNDYEFNHDNGTPYNPDDDTRRSKDNNAHAVFTTTYANGWSIGERDHLSSMVSLSKRRKEFYHKHLADPTQLASQEATEMSGFVRWERQTADQGYLGARLDGRYKRSLFSDPLGTFYVGGKRRDQEDYPYLSLRLEGLRALGDILTVQGFLRGSYEAYTSENLLAQPSGEAPFARRLAAAGAVELAVRRDRLRAAVRYHHVYAQDSANFEPSHGNGEPLPRNYDRHYPNANAEVTWLALQWLALDCSIRHEVLPISLSDRYGWGENYRGNPKLRPQQHTEVDIGTTVGTERMQTSLAGFAGYVQDVIEVQTNSQMTIMAHNAGDMRLCGLEWDARLHLGRYLAVDNHFTYTYRLKRSVGGRWDEAGTPLYFSPIEDDLRLTATLGRWRTGISASYRSPYWKGHTKATDREVLGPTVNAYVNVDLFERVTLTYRVENVFDVTVEPFLHYTPLPGRMHFGVVQIRF
ncbi:MAG: TonB-dependent receptor [Chitinivibrionales bacterium]|nr:TonB-dependent receptor [Chitinivibrionales bacterium]